MEFLDELTMCRWNVQYGDYDYVKLRTIKNGQTYRLETIYDTHLDANPAAPPVIVFLHSQVVWYYELEIGRHYLMGWR
jgi:hypothetical protein